MGVVVHQEDTPTPGNMSVVSKILYSKKKLVHDQKSRLVGLSVYVGTCMVFCVQSNSTDG